MRKLIFILILFFSTNAFAGGKLQKIPFSLTDVLNEGYKIIDQYSTEYFRYYLFHKKNEKIIICRVDLDMFNITSCFIEEIDERYVESE